MNILIEAAGIRAPGGTRTAVISLLHSLLSQDSRNRYLVLVDSFEPSLSSFGNVTQFVVPTRNRIMVRLWQQIAIPALVYRNRIDLIHYTKGLGCLIDGCKTVLTVYDLTNIVLSSTLSWMDVWYWKVVQPLVARRADWIITGSEDAKGDIVRLLGVGEHKIRVIPFGISPAFRPDIAAGEVGRVKIKYGLPDRYMLFVGNLNRKKNLATLIKAFHSIKEASEFSLGLVVVGGRYRRSDDVGVTDLVESLGLGHSVVFAGSVPDDELVAVYKGALAFAFPSLHEGFGLAPLEAMACGVPVVSSAAGSLGEVLKDAAFRVENPLDAEELASAILKVLADAELRAKLISRGLELVQGYSWATTARDTLALYKKVLET